ncbi:hypothetical protein EAH89_17370 [Roseomonas nepalensis]|uniref:Uncharacterized protein n=2 Tax=Muricoccus nepalensis TaxID=1854500 RepID=A0A502FUJ1_9PROT|nr:hypothetical protein EAH89_17370 [Roseomonas nepalensis]
MDGLTEALPAFGLRSTSSAYTGAAGLWQRSLDNATRTVNVNSTGTATSADKAWATAGGGHARWLEVNFHDGVNKFVTAGFSTAPRVTFDTLGGIADVVGIQNDDGVRYLYTVDPVIPAYAVPTPNGSSRWRMLYTMIVRHDAWVSNGRTLSLVGDGRDFDWNNVASMALWAAYGSYAEHLYSYSDNGYRYDFSTPMPAFGTASVVQLETNDNPFDDNNTQITSWTNGASSAGGPDSYGSYSAKRAMLFVGGQGLDFNSPEKARATIYGGFGAHGFGGSSRQKHSGWAAQTIGDTANPDYVAPASPSGSTSGAGAAAVAGPLLSGTGTSAAPSFAGSGAAAVAGPTIVGAGSRTVLSFSGTAVAAVAGPIVAGSGTQAAPVVLGAAAASVTGPSAAGSGASQKPAATGVASAVVAGPVLAGSGAAAAPGVSGSGSGAVAGPAVAASGAFSPAVVNGTGAVVVAGPAATGAGTRTAPVFSGSGALAIAASIVVAVGSFVAPGITGSGGATVEGPGAAGSGTATASGFAGSGTGAVSGPALAGSGSRSGPSFTGSGAAVASGPTAAASGSAGGPSTAGAGDGVVAGPRVVGGGAAGAPIFAGTGSATVSGPVLSGSGARALPVQGTAAASVAGPTVQAAGSSTPPMFSGIGGSVATGPNAAGMGITAPPTVAFGAAAVRGPQLAGAGQAVAPTFAGVGGGAIAAPVVLGAGPVSREGIIPTFAHLTASLPARAALSPRLAARAALRAEPRLIARLGMLRLPLTGDPEMVPLRVSQGQQCRAVVRFVDADGLAMPATGVAITVRSPITAHVMPLVPVELSVGTFAADWVADEHGVWHVRGECTGPAAAVDEGPVVVTPSQVLA